MSSETVDWLKKVKVSFDVEEGEEEEVKSKFGKKPQANAIYSAKDLAGLKVAHDFNSFQAGQSDILVLEDKSVLEVDDNASESLISMNLKEEARLKRMREVSRHAKGYSGFKAYEEEVEEDSIVTIGGNGPKLSGKVLQKYDFASSEFNDEPGVEGFKLGMVKSEKELWKNEGKSSNTMTSTVSDFDTVQSSGIETIGNFKRKGNKTDLEKERKRAKKLAKTLFADEPEMLTESEMTAESPSEIKFGFEEEEDNLEIQKIISATRREHLKTAVPVEMNIEEEEPKFVGGKSFDALIMSESIFANNNTVELEEGDDVNMKNEEENIVSATVAQSEDEAMDADVDGDADTLVDTFAFTQEPLVRNGVASTLALLNMKGISLKPRSSNEKGTTGKGSDIKLEYFDQFGNKLSSKEAYKELSRKFHGKGPGKDRLEKMKRKRVETLKLEAAASSPESAIVTNLRKQQQETGVPYMLLSNTRHSDSVQIEIPEAKQQEKKTKIFGLQLKKK